VSDYRIPYIFQHWHSINRGSSVEKNFDATPQSSYYTVFTEVIKILKTKILKYLKLITINLQSCNINSIKRIKTHPFHVQHLFPNV
jgi:hypothetical protein